jgi:cytochrome c
MKGIWFVVAALSVGLMLGGIPRAEVSTIDLTQWPPPDIGMLGDDPFGKLVKYGHKLFTDTANEIGPAVSDPAKRLAGNNLACENCHLRRRHSALCHASGGGLGPIPTVPSQGGHG